MYLLVLRLCSALVVKIRVLTSIASLLRFGYLCVILVRGVIGYYITCSSSSLLFSCFVFFYVIVLLLLMWNNTVRSRKIH